MISTLLFDFNNVLLFVEESAIARVAKSYIKIDVPASYSKCFYLNTELLDFIQTKRPETKTVILTASEFSLYQPEIKEIVVPYFDLIFFAKEKGWVKDLPSTYLQVSQQMQTNPAEILFVDDTLANVEAAKKAGMQTHHFFANQDIMRLLTS